MTTTETWPHAQPPIHGDRGDQQLAALAETRDYTRRIHWWIRLVGVVWLTTMALGLLAGVALGILAVATANEPDDASNPFTRDHYSSRANCMAAPKATFAQCDTWFPNR